MKDESVYAKQTFGQKTGFGRNTALLVVDFVNGFVDPEIFGGGNILGAVKATVPLLDFFVCTSVPLFLLVSFMPMMVQMPGYGAKRCRVCAN